MYVCFKANRFHLKIVYLYHGNIIKVMTDNVVEIVYEIEMHKKEQK